MHKQRGILMQPYKQGNNRKGENGFTLLEAMLATVIVGVGFVSIFSLTVFSERSLHTTVQKEKLELIANQMMEVIEADLDNFTLYDVDLTDNNVCINAAAADQNIIRNARINEWCQRIADEISLSGTNVRDINAFVDPVDGTRILNIVLEAKNGEAQVVINRSFGED